MHDARCTVRSSGVLQNWLSKLQCSHPTHFCEELQGKHRMLSTESPTVARARVGVDTHRNTLSHKAALVTIQLLSKVSCLPSKVSSLRPLHSWQYNVPTVAALNVFLTALSYTLLFYVGIYPVSSADCALLWRTGIQFVMPSKLWCCSLLLNMKELSQHYLKSVLQEPFFYVFLDFLDVLGKCNGSKIVLWTLLGIHGQL